MEHLRKLHRSAVAWAAVTAVLGVVGALWNPFLMLAAVVTAWQWGALATAESYERGIICADCGDRLDDGEMPERL